MKDFAGNELTVGSEIAFIEPGERSLTRGIIIGITEKRVRVERHTTHSWKKKETIIDPTLTAVKIGGQ